jgi:membrane protein YqaA with SNARE-associated domain
MVPISPWVESYGLGGLTLIAFLAATLLPLSSEIAVVAALQLGLPPASVLLCAALGNSAGAMTNYAMGWWLTPTVRRRLQQTYWGRTAWAWAVRYGGWSLAASCLPLIGDPIMLVGGVLRYQVRYVVWLGLGTRIARYILLVLLTQP